MDILKIVRMLIEFDHCGFFTIDTYYGEHEKLNMRNMTNNDFENFTYKGEYRCGTLNDVRHFQTNQNDELNKITYLKFDTESG